SSTKWRRTNLLTDRFNRRIFIKHWLAYEADKDILEAYGDTVALKRRRDDQDKDKEPSAGSNRGSKR
ncbi:hypothetical protein Tco_0513158, partial [Tanacetum coccineum]